MMRIVALVESPCTSDVQAGMLLPNVCVYAGTLIACCCMKSKKHTLLEARDFSTARSSKLAKARNVRFT